MNGCPKSRKIQSLSPFFKSLIDFKNPQISVRLMFRPDCMLDCMPLLLKWIQQNLFLDKIKITFVKISFSTKTSVTFAQLKIRQLFSNSYHVWNIKIEFKNNSCLSTRWSPVCTSIRFGELFLIVSKVEKLDWLISLPEIQFLTIFIRSDFMRASGSILT